MIRQVLYLLIEIYRYFTIYIVVDSHQYPCVSILSASCLSMTNRVSIFLFSIPTTQSGVQSFLTDAIPVQPFWSYEFLDCDTGFRPSRWDVDLDRHLNNNSDDRVVAIMTTRRLHLLSLAGNQANPTVQPYPIKGLRREPYGSVRSVAGFRRAVFASVKRKKIPTIVLKSCAYLTCPVVWIMEAFFDCRDAQGRNPTSEKLLEYHLEMTRTWGIYPGTKSGKCVCYSFIPGAMQRLS
jgi:hypothetical protein